MIRAAPLRFLAAVLVGWIGFRLIALAPNGSGQALPDSAVLASRTPSGSRSAEAVATALQVRHLAPATRFAIGPGSLPEAPGGERPSATRASLAAAALSTLPDVPVLAPALSSPPLADRRPTPFVGAAPRLPAQTPLAWSRTSRWSGSAWLFVRPAGGQGVELAPGGVLGGSQAGGRLGYRINHDARRPLALSGRAYLPLDRPAGAEASVGLDWRPLASVPIHVLAERRERIGREGRSDFALSLYGGGERRLAGIRLEAYGQAGVVGVKERDLFADGLARASFRIGPVEAGIGLWGGAQPEAARLDLGPQASVQLPAAGLRLRAAAEWRIRIAGDAAPGSGPAVTLSSGF